MPTTHTIPIQPVSTGGLVPWAITQSQIAGRERVEAFMDACAYNLDAPSFMPSGSHAHYKSYPRHRNFIGRMGDEE
jgi:hypothetical protein